MFEPKKHLTKHDVEVQIHTIESIIISMKETRLESINIATLEKFLALGQKQLSSMNKGGN